MGRIVGSFSSEEERRKKKGPGVGSKLLYGLSLLERPAQALKVGIKEAIDDDDEGFVEGLKQGWLGEDEVRGQEVMFDKEYIEKHPILAGISGFLFDVATDPLTYAGGFLFKGASVGAKAAYRTLPGSSREAVAKGVKDLGQSKIVEDIARGVNVPYGKAKQVKVEALKHLNKLQQNKNVTDKLINQYQKYAKKRAKELGVDQDQVHRGFITHIEGKGKGDLKPVTYKSKKGVVTTGSAYGVPLDEAGVQLASEHTQIYKDMLKQAGDMDLRVGVRGRQADMWNPVEEYIMHVATPAARKLATYDDDIAEFAAMQGTFKQAKYPGTTLDANDFAYAGMGNENMFHINPAIIMGVRSRQHAQAIEAKWFREEIMSPTRSMGLWFKKGKEPGEILARKGPTDKWRKATPEEELYETTGLRGFKRMDDVKDPETGLVQLGDTVLEEFRMPKEVSKMVKERHELFAGRKANDFIKFYDEVQNGWKRWTLGVRPAYHTRNMVGNYLNAWMISGVTNPARYVDSGVMQRNAFKGTLDDTQHFAGKTGQTKLPFTEKELYDEIDSRGGIGGLYSEDIQRTAEEAAEAAAGVGGGVKKFAKGETPVVRKAFEYGAQIESNPRIAVFLDTLIKARKNPSKYKWYDADTGKTIDLHKAKNEIAGRYARQLSRHNRYEKEIETGLRKGKKLTQAQIDQSIYRRNAIETSLRRDWTRKIGIKKDAPSEPEDLKGMLNSLYKHDKDRAFFDVAGFEMKKSLFDYNDLSRFERDVMKRFIPFYTWSRKNIPAQLQALVKNPQRAEKLHIAREQFEHQGGEPDDRDVGPMWSGTVPIFLGKETEGVRSFFSLLNYAPIADLERVGSPSEIIKQMVSPLIKEPLEQVFNYDLFRDRKIKEFKGQKKDFLGVALPPGAWHAVQLLVPLVEINRLNPGNIFGLQKKTDITGDIEITKGWWGLGASRESNPVDIPGLARTIRFFMGVRRYDLDLQKSREWNKKKFVRDLTTLKARLKWARKKDQRRKAEEITALIDQILSGEVINPLLNQ